MRDRHDYYRCPKCESINVSLTKDASIVLHQYEVMGWVERDVQLDSVETFDELLDLTCLDCGEYTDSDPNPWGRDNKEQAS